MKKVKIHDTELKVSRVGMGGIAITRPPLKDAIKVIHRALDLGINFFDTANGYSTSEERFGEALSTYDIDRKDIVICSRNGKTDKDSFQLNFDKSLSRLRTDYIDIYQIHNISTIEKYDTIMSENGALNVLNKLKKKGAIKYIGISGHNVDIMLKAVKTGHFDVIQYPLNFISNEALDELLPYCIENNIGFIAMKPFAGGRVNNANLAIKYLMQFDKVIPDPGVEKISEIEEIVDIIDSNNYEISPSEQDEINTIKSELGTKFCRQCEYCKPCPQDININMVLITKVMHKIWPYDDYRRIMEGSIEPARECIECGRCETRCPYLLPIQDLLKENIQYYDVN